MPSFLPIGLMDWCVVLWVALGSYAGSRMGIVCTSFYLAAGWAGSFAALRLYLPVSVYLSLGDRSPSVSYFLVFLVVAGAIAASGPFVSRRYEHYFLGISDRFIGGMIGMGMSLVLAGSLFVSWTIRPHHSFVRRAHNSVLVPVLVRWVGKNLKVLPHPVANELDQTVRDLEREKARRHLRDMNSQKP